MFPVLQVHYIIHKYKTLENLSSDLGDVPSITCTLHNYKYKTPDDLSTAHGDVPSITDILQHYMSKYLKDLSTTQLVDVTMLQVNNTITSFKLWRICH